MGRMIGALLGFAMVVGAAVGPASPDPIGTAGRHADKGVEKEEKTLTLFLDEAKSVKMEFVWIKPGKFTMGSPEGEKDRESDEKQHEVTLTKGYWMQVTEVTQGQWEYIMGKNPSFFKGADLPVAQVSWNDFQEFIKKVNEKAPGALRADLPTEAEWEYACRAGSTGRWCFGEDEGKLGEYAWYDKNSESRTHPVGQKKANGWGLYDMHGNVWEWCKDRHGDYPGDMTDPQGPSSGQYRLLRGGSWDVNDRYTRSANRYRYDPANRGNGNGGRLVLR